MDSERLSETQTGNRIGEFPGGGHVSATANACWWLCAQGQPCLSDQSHGASRVLGGRRLDEENDHPWGQQVPAPSRKQQIGSDFCDILCIRSLLDFLTVFAGQGSEGSFVFWEEPTLNPKGKNSEK